jgi:hypothetical protein
VKAVAVVLVCDENKTPSIVSLCQDKNHLQHVRAKHNLGKDEVETFTTRCNNQDTKTEYHEKYLYAISEPDTPLPRPPTTGGHVQRVSRL